MQVRVQEIIPKEHLEVRVHAQRARGGVVFAPAANGPRERLAPLERLAEQPLGDETGDGPRREDGSLSAKIASETSQVARLRAQVRLRRHGVRELPEGLLEVEPAEGGHAGDELRGALQDLKIRKICRSTPGCRTFTAPRASESGPAPPAAATSAVRVHPGTIAEKTERSPPAPPPNSAGSTLGRGSEPRRPAPTRRTPRVSPADPRDAKARASSGSRAAHAVAISGRSTHRYTLRDRPRRDGFVWKMREDAGRRDAQFSPPSAERLSHGMSGSVVVQRARGVAEILGDRRRRTDDVRRGSPAHRRRTTSWRSGGTPTRGDQRPSRRTRSRVLRVRRPSTASEDAETRVARDSAASNRGTARKNTGRNASVR